MIQLFIGRYTSVTGNYVLLELSTDYTTTGYGETGAGENGETVMGRPGNGEDRPETMEEMPEGEFQGDSGERMNGEANDDTQRNALPGNREGGRMGGMSQATSLLLR